jgi:hypothetical protein
MRNTQFQNDSAFSSEKLDTIIEVYEQITPDVLNYLVLEFSLMQRIYMLSEDANCMGDERKREFQSNMYMFERLLRAAI